jgi:hypothetical protein
MMDYRQLITRIKEVEGINILLDEENESADIRLKDVVFDDYPYTEKISNSKDFKEKRLYPILSTARVVKIQQ